ncbi:MAG: hypothetical protein AAFW60_11415, partial [Pseudomonadota bacterium]
MSLLNFALETRAATDMASDEALRLNVGFATLLSEALQLLGDRDFNRLMPGAGLCTLGSRLVPTVLANGSAVRVADDGLVPIGEFPILR